MPRKRATIREVARATGLSQAAVSYALRGVQVAPETVERVRAAAAELGYEADPIARALASGRTGMIGVLCASLEDLWQQSLAVGISRGLRERDRYALILDAAGDPARERALARPAA
ncbi:LacI family DNA-binding transcriptional regulator [Nonomuraea ferruginea]